MLRVFAPSHLSTEIDEQDGEPEKVLDLSFSTRDRDRGAENTSGGVFHINVEILWALSTCDNSVESQNAASITKHLSLAGLSFFEQSLKALQM